MRAASFFFCVVVCAAALPAHADREADDGRQGAYRLGSAASKLAVLPVRCARDMDTALCSSIDESLAVDLARDPRIDIVTPRDLEVLLGAQQLVELSTCEADAGCFDASSFTQLQADHLLSVSIGRIGGDAMITVRLVDLKRGIVIDRDDARAWRGSEAGIDEATRALARTILVRRGVATPPKLDVDEDRGSPVAFWGGAGVAGLGVVGLGVAGYFGFTALSQVNALQFSSGLSQTTYDNAAAAARQNAFYSDVALAGGGALVVGGAVMMILGSL